ncbi:hypothetical protein [Caballeronia telluris]|uniref:hypothetical protein n=1 Tax=Caballeronia telluris TaxID=326475 RepID=UPI001F46F4D4|nr:hypothetical protein [Caballeronia telluris]
MQNLTDLVESNERVDLGASERRAARQMPRVRHVLYTAPDRCTFGPAYVRAQRGLDSILRLPVEVGGPYRRIAQEQDLLEQCFARLRVPFPWRGFAARDETQQVLELLGVCIFFVVDMCERLIRRGRQEQDLAGALACLIEHLVGDDAVLTVVVAAEQLLETLKLVKDEQIGFEIARARVHEPQTQLGEDAVECLWTSCFVARIQRRAAAQ